VFWVAHRRLWLYVGPGDKGTTLLLGGQSNKNKLQFEKDFNEIKSVIDNVTGEGK
jgi:cytochrome c biogenesis protein